MNRADGSDSNPNVCHVVRQKQRAFITLEDARVQCRFLLQIIVNVIDHHVGVVLGAIENADENRIERCVYESTRRQTTESIAANVTSRRIFASSVVEDKPEPKKSAEKQFQHDASLRFAQTETPSGEKRPFRQSIVPLR